MLARRFAWFMLFGLLLGCIASLEAAKIASSAKSGPILPDHDAHHIPHTENTIHTGIKSVSLALSSDHRVFKVATASNAEMGWYVISLVVSAALCLVYRTHRAFLIATISLLSIKRTRALLKRM